MTRRIRQLVQVREEMRAKKEASEAELHRVGDVEGLRLSANGLEWFRRMAKRELQEREAHLAGASPFIGQSDRAFAEAYAKIERKVVFLQDLLSAIERAKISTT